jgi:hypothetical protein
MAAESAPTRTVTIPRCDEHDGFHSVTVTLLWRCPRCGGPRGEVFRTISYDGSRRLGCDGWKNPCGHVDYYSAVRREAGLSTAGR